MIGECDEGLDREALTRALRDVVEHDRQVSRVGDGAAVRDEAGLGRLAVVGHDEQQSLRARLWRHAKPSRCCGRWSMEHPHAEPVRRPSEWPRTGGSTMRRRGLMHA